MAAKHMWTKTETWKIGICSNFRWAFGEIMLINQECCSCFRELSRVGILLSEGLSSWKFIRSITDFWRFSSGFARIMDKLEKRQTTCQCFYAAMVVAEPAGCQAAASRVPCSKCHLWQRCRFTSVAMFHQPAIAIVYMLPATGRSGYGIHPIHIYTQGQA